MVEINKESNKYVQNEIFIKTDEGKFSISLGNDNNLYMGLYKLENSDENKITFTITKEDYFIYSLFYKLYYDIKNNKPSNISPTLLKDGNYRKLLDKKSPLKNKTVEWHSEDTKYGESTVMQISKDTIDEIKVTFIKGNSKDYINNYFVKINTSKSIYYPFNQNFIDLYKKLNEYSDNKYHQIHIEEYRYNMARTRK